MKRVERVSMVESVVTALENEIKTGHWPLGTQIPSENQLVEQLGVSRTPVREAIRSLVQLGLLKSRQGLGTFVVATDVNQVAMNRRLEDADQDDVMHVREGLDITAARLAAATGAEAHLPRLEEALARRLACFRADDAAGFIEADLDFHVGVAEASGNPVLHDLYRSLADFESQGLHPAFAFGDFSEGDRDLHAELLSAIRAKDVESATTTALALLDHTRNHPAFHNV
ncbi:FadR/GntR family transcriptional regulator [Microbacterium sp. NPDC057659]|uniref:FadR/GntR family transcriptional regulator n=1 Tax=Microbacterium sp. NPDC057659 TaxID=3346198 RepID=UPI0036734E39